MSGMSYTRQDQLGSLEQRSPRRCRWILKEGRGRGVRERMKGRAVVCLRLQAKVLDPPLYGHDFILRATASTKYVNKWPFRR